MTYPTAYKVEYWDDFTQQTKTTYGLIYATTAGDAVAQIEDWYGADTINSVEVHLLEHQLIEISKDYFNTLLENA
jgi:hypothetical protein